MFTGGDYEPDGLFGSRNISPEATKGAFFPYQQDAGDDDRGLQAVLEADPRIRELGDAAVHTVRDRVRRAPGIVMRRFPVPEGDPFILAEMRPKWAIWTGKPPTEHDHNELSPAERENHLKPETSKTKPEDVWRGCTPAEYKRFSKLYGFEVTGGGDHFGRDVGGLHVHIKIAKYLFQKNEQKTIEDPDGPHAHTDYDGTLERLYRGEDPHADKTLEGLYRHIDSKQHLKERRESWQERAEYMRARGLDPAGLNPDGKYRKLVHVTPTLRKSKMTGRDRLVYKDGLPAKDEIHPHYVNIDSEFYAKRLSIHPWSRAALDNAGRIVFALEGCLKETAAVVAGEVTFSCPSVSLWDAPELAEFAGNHLGGKTVWVVCDSDWEREDGDSVIRMALLARDALRRYGADAHIAAPPPATCDEHGPGTKADGKHGLDDHLGPCTRGKVDDLVWVERETPWGLTDWLEVNPPPGRKPREEGVDRDAIVLRWIAKHASKNGSTTVALSTVAKNIKGELQDLRDRQAARRDKTADRVSRTAAEKVVQDAIRNLVKYEIVKVIQPLSARTRFHLRAKKVEWTGKLRIIVEELQARTDTSRTIRDYVPPSERRRGYPALSEDQAGTMQEAVSDPG